jgi:hypothetical protein
MYFTECARLADRHPDLADLVTKIDAHLNNMGTAEVIRKADLASFLRADPNQVGSVLENLAQGGLLQAEEMVECTFCRMAVLRTDFEETREEDGEYACTSCDRLLTDRTVDLITTYRRGKMWGQDELSPHMAAAVVATLSLRELSRIRGLYPTAIRDGDAAEFREALSAHLSAALEDESLQDIRDSLYKEVKLDEPDADAMLTVLLTTLVMRCPGVCIAGADEEAMRMTMDRAIEACRKKVASPLKAIVDQLMEIKIVDCRIPEGDDPAFSDPRRSLQLLQAYWSLGRAIVVNQMNAYVSLRPHPLLRLVTNLRARMEVYFGRLSDQEGSLDAYAAGDRLLDVAVGGDPDELSAVPEWTNEEVQKVDSFLERVRLGIGAKSFPLTHEEKVFIEQAEAAIEDYRNQANTAWNRVLERMDEQGIHVGGNDDNANKNGAVFPTPPGSSWLDVDIRFVDGHTVSAKAGGQRKRYSYIEMGFADGRSKNPSKQWELLRTFADEKGVLDWTSSAADRRNQKRKENLSKDLRRFFQIDEQPFELTADRKGWRAKFTIGWTE